jgi:hypothetical protein
MFKQLKYKLKLNFNANAIVLFYFCSYLLRTK